MTLVLVNGKPQPADYPYLFLGEDDDGNGGRTIRSARMARRTTTDEMALTGLDFVDRALAPSDVLTIDGNVVSPAA